MVSRDDQQPPVLPTNSRRRRCCQASAIRSGCRTRISVSSLNRATTSSRTVHPAGSSSVAPNTSGCPPAAAGCQAATAVPAEPSSATAAASPPSTPGTTPARLVVGHVHRRLADKRRHRGHVISSCTGTRFKVPRPRLPRGLGLQHLRSRRRRAPAAVSGPAPASTPSTASGSGCSPRWRGRRRLVRLLRHSGVAESRRSGIAGRPRWGRRHRRTRRLVTVGLGLSG